MNSRETLIETYRVRWDAYHVIADENAERLREGMQPSTEQLIEEHLAADAVDQARRDLEAALTRWH